MKMRKHTHTQRKYSKIQTCARENAIAVLVGLIKNGEAEICCCFSFSGKLFK